MYIKNPELIELINEHFQDPISKDIALTYAICVELGTITTLYELGLFKSIEDEHKYRILLVCEDEDWDGSTRKYKLRYSLFTENNNVSKFDEYLLWLKKNPKLKAVSGRFDGLYETRQAFKAIESTMPDFSRLQACTEDFYVKQGQYAPKLLTFITGHLRAEYDAWEKSKSKLI